MLPGQRGCARAHSTVPYFHGAAHQINGAKAAWVTWADVVVHSIAVSWARAQMHSIVSCLGSIIDALDHNSVRSIALTGTFYSFANFHPQTAFVY